MSPLRRQLFFAALYFSEGAPVGWLWWTLRPQLRRGGEEIAEVAALFAALALPWACKFLWAPLVDLLQTRRFGLRGWILCAQAGMAATLLPLIALDPATGLGWAVPLLIAHAFFAATQDVAIDALAIRTTPVAERGRLNGAMQCGYIGGRILFSSGALWAAPRLGPHGDRIAVAFLVLAVAATAVLVALHPPVPERPPRARLRRMLRFAAALLRSRRIWFLALFALVGGAGFEAAGALFDAWMVDRGHDRDAMAGIRLGTAAAMAAGAVLGGIVADRLERRRAAGLWLVAVALVALLVALADARGAAGSALAGYVALYFALGGFTAASYGLFMASASGPLRATVFSAFMGLTNFCESWSGHAAGQIAGGAEGATGRVDYAPAIAVMAAISLLGLPLLSAARRRPRISAPAS